MTASVPWRMGAGVEYANGFRATVIHVDGEFAILRSHPDSRLAPPFNDGDGFIVAQGDMREFSFVDEADPIRVRLDEATAQLVAARDAPPEEPAPAKKTRG